MSGVAVCLLTNLWPLLYAVRSVCEEDLDKVLADMRIYSKTIRLLALDFYGQCHCQQFKQ